MKDALRTLSSLTNSCGESHAAPPTSGLCRCRYTFCATRYPKTLPTSTSDGKCCPARMRDKLTAEAAPYAKSVGRVPGYSCANTPAIDQAAAACSEGNDVPPWKKAPLPLL